MLLFRMLIKMFVLLSGIISKDMGASESSMLGDEEFAGDLKERLKAGFLEELCRRPGVGLTEVRRDGKDNAAVAAVINREFTRCSSLMTEKDFVDHMRTYASACWVSGQHLFENNFPSSFLGIVFEIFHMLGQF